MIDYENIPWEKQCDFCLKAINTTYCNETKRVIENLKNIEKNSKGKIDSFTCQFFSPDTQLLPKE